MATFEIAPVVPGNETEGVVAPYRNTEFRPTHRRSEREPNRWSHPGFHGGSGRPRDVLDALLAHILAGVRRMSRI